MSLIFFFGIRCQESEMFFLNYGLRRNLVGSIRRRDRSPWFVQLLVELRQNPGPDIAAPVL